ncbi:MAG: hypothetical protein OXE79_05225 [Acidimicrobiaceae bacterium]|nr:hypothetical protein [Acidimicrobiaceae bacterium]MCY4281069.1 hypothetical protein [Acidimicrobiaceae bacterium]
MKNDICPAVPPPPADQPRIRITVPQLFAMGESELEEHLKELLDWSGFDQQPQQASADGSPRVSSLLAVWLISQVGGVVGGKKLINLSEVENKECLRSLAGIAGLLHSAIANRRLVRKAS